MRKIENVYYKNILMFKNVDEQYRLIYRDLVPNSDTY